MPGCVALNCSNRSENGFLLFSIPTNVERRKKWLQSLRREQWIPTKSACVCEVYVQGLLLTGRGNAFRAAEDDAVSQYKSWIEFNFDARWILCICWLAIASASAARNALPRPVCSSPNAVKVEHYLCLIKVKINCFPYYRYTLMIHSSKIDVPMAG